MHLCTDVYNEITEITRNQLVSRGQTTISAQGVIAYSISARAEKGLEQFTGSTGTGTFKVSIRSKAKQFDLKAHAP